VINFTCADNATLSPYWPSLSQLKQGLHVVHFWHNLQFTDVWMSAYWYENGEIKDITNKQVQLNINDE
jgi:hypothetical protein